MSNIDILVKEIAAVAVQRGRLNAFVELGNWMMTQPDPIPAINLAAYLLQASDNVSPSTLQITHQEGEPPKA